MNSTETTTVQLRSGEKLTIEVCEPPFPGGEHSLCWWGDIAADLMAGKLRPWLYTPYYLGKIDGELVGYMGCQTPADMREVGLVEFVWTAEAHRRKGIASLLLGRLVEEFAQAWGDWPSICVRRIPMLAACTSVMDSAISSEMGCAIWHPGAEDFDRDYLDGGSPAEVRDATWADPAGGVSALQPSRAEVGRQGLPEREFSRHPLREPTL